MPVLNRAALYGLMFFAIATCGCSRKGSEPNSRVVYVRVLNPTPVDIDSVTFDSSANLRPSALLTLRLDDKTQESNFERVKFPLKHSPAYRIFRRGKPVGWSGVPIDHMGPEIQNPQLPPGNYPYRVRLTVIAPRDSSYVLLPDD